jgi:hypothetical protein
MSDSIDQAKEAIEKADTWEERRVAVLIAILAVALALAGMARNSAQNDYLAYHIQASDDWNFYQAKQVRSNLYQLQADTLDSLPAGTDPTVRKRINEWRVEAKRLDDDEKTQGLKQLMQKAQASEVERGHAFHHFHLFESVTGGLEIAIVLASVSIVTRIRALAVIAAVLGAGASLFGLAADFDMF